MAKRIRNKVKNFLAAIGLVTLVYYANLYLNLWFYVLMLWQGMDLAGWLDGVDPYKVITPMAIIAVGSLLLLGFAKLVGIRTKKGAA
jgi:hypothetical protein